jgi:hypothetical protein
MKYKIINEFGKVIDVEYLLHPTTEETDINTPSVNHINKEVSSSKKSTKQQKTKK